MESKFVYELLALIGGAMAGYGAMFVFLIKWMTRKNDELLKIMLGNDRAWKAQTTESLADIRECVDHGDCCAYKADKENVHERLNEIRTAVVGREGA
ncbi:hypothetical protein K8I61_11645 [bacterium]|nr:hypothetical protein [bacterium]